MDRREFARTAALGAVALGLGPGLGLADGPGAMRRYVQRVRADLTRFRLQQADDTARAGDMLAELLSQGGKLWVHDRRGPYSAEAIGRAGGLMAIHRLRPGGLERPTNGDAIIIVADEAGNEEDIEVAKGARVAGAWVLGICPVRVGKPGLAAECDMALANYASDEDAAVPIRGIEGRIGPTSGVMNTTIMWALIAGYIEGMERRGKTPQVWMSIKRPGAAEFNQEARARAEEVGY